MTRDELKEKLLALKADDICPPGTGSYLSQFNGKPCIVGALLNREEIHTIVKSGRNSSGVNTLMNEGYLPDRLHANVRDLVELQNVFDHSNASADQFIQDMQSIVKGAFRAADGKEPHLD